jgi:predicted MFS family arabinose efflux permease
VGAGQALGGRLLEGPGYPTVFMLAASAALAAALLAWTLRTRALRVRAQT